MESVQPVIEGIYRMESGRMNGLSMFGLFAVTAMVVCYAMENRSSWFVLGFAGSCALGSVYGFLQGAWPFGLVEGIWSVIAVKRWWAGRSRAISRSTSAPNR